MGFEDAGSGHPLLPFAAGGFQTPSGKCEFKAETRDYRPLIEPRHGGGAVFYSCLIEVENA